MYSNNILNFQVYDNFEYLYKKFWKLIECTTYLRGEKAVEQESDGDTRCS